MRTSIDILNYFRRKKRQKKYQREIAKLKQQIYNLRQDVRMYRNKREPFRLMYNDLISVLENVDEHCALKSSTKICAPHPLRRFSVHDYNISASKNYDESMISEYHCVNLYTAEALIRDYKVEECIHFELNTGDNRYRYQYSKKGLDVQTPVRLLKQVTQLIASAWYNKIHN